MRFSALEKEKWQFCTSWVLFFRPQDFVGLTMCTFFQVQPWHSSLPEAAKASMAKVVISAVATNPPGAEIFFCRIALIVSPHSRLLYRGTGWQRFSIPTVLNQDWSTTHQARCCRASCCRASCCRASIFGDRSAPWSCSRKGRR